MGLQLSHSNLRGNLFEYKAGGQVNAHFLEAQLDCDVLVRPPKSRQAATRKTRAGRSWQPAARNLYFEPHSSHYVHDLQTLS